MPQTAAKLGLNYTHVAIDGEPAQATQLFTTMIATAFVETDIDKILDAGMAAVDPKSKIAEVVTTVREFCRDNPNDWQATRLAIKDRWQTHGGIMRDRNGYELNTACVIAALLYGHKDFVETLRTAFNFGWDADCDAATAATIVGVMKGRRWMNDQGWDIKDIYRNTTRDDMPNDETLTGLENLRHRSRPHHHQKKWRRTYRRTQPTYLSHSTEQPANIEPLSTPPTNSPTPRKSSHPSSRMTSPLPGVTRARAAYLAICLGEAEKLKANSPESLVRRHRRTRKAPRRRPQHLHRPRTRQPATEAGRPRRRPARASEESGQSVIASSWLLDSPALAGGYSGSRTVGAPPNDNRKSNRPPKKEEGPRQQ